MSVWKSQRKARGAYAEGFDGQEDGIGNQVKGTEGEDAKRHGIGLHPGKNGARRCQTNLFPVTRRVFRCEIEDNPPIVHPLAGYRGLG